MSYWKNESKIQKATCIQDDIIYQRIVKITL